MQMQVEFGHAVSWHVPQKWSKDAFLSLVRLSSVNVYLVTDIEVQRLESLSSVNVYLVTEIEVQRLDP